MIREADGGGFVISSHQVWLPGVYEDERAARFAFRFADAELQSLADKVCATEGRLITSADLRSARTEQPRSPRA